MRIALPLLPLFAASLAGGCERTTFSTTAPKQATPTHAGSAPPASRAAMLASVARCVTTELTTFRGDADALTTTLATAKTAADARPTLAKTMGSWQRLEALQVGPAASASEPGGQGLRPFLYAWPLWNRCVVEQQLVQKTWEAPGIDGLLVNARGLGALEYLVFYDGSDNACAATATINANGSWAALSADELSSRKLAFARALSADVAKRAADLEGRWLPTGGNFEADLANGTGVYTSPQQALNALSNALFYLEGEVKDQKVGRPLGLVDCTATTCPEALESRFAKASADYVRQNLAGFTLAFRGCGEPRAGLYDLLVAAGAESTAKSLEADLAAATGALDAFEGRSFDEVLATDKAKVEALHEALRAIVTTMRTEVLSILDLDLPQRLEGDND